MSDLEILKIMALKNTHEFKALYRLRKLKELTVLTLSQSYLPNLYHTISKLQVDQIEIEEWIHPYLYPPLDEITERKKSKYKAKIGVARPEIKLSTIPPEPFSRRQLILH